MPGEVHRLGLQILLELLRRSGAAANFLDESKSPAEIREFVKHYAPDLVFLSCTMTECAPAAAELVRALKLDSPGLTIICGGSAGLSEGSELLKAGASQICETRSDVRRAVRLCALWRAASRSAGLGRQHFRATSPTANVAQDAIASSPGAPDQRS